jgi:hypothetical protein
LHLRTFGEGLPTSGQWRDGFDVADMNGDGHPDIVHGPPRKGGGDPRVFLGDGHGRWHAWSDTHFPSLGWDYGAVRAGDFDGDGVRDLVVAMHLRGIVTLRGDGLGGFQRGLPLPGSDPGAGAFSSRALRVTDWDRDGRLDIVALGEGPRLGRNAGGSFGLRIFLGRPDAWVRRTEPEPAVIFGRALALTHVDERSAAVTASSVLGRTDLLCTATDDGGCTRHTIAAVPARAYVRAVAAGDVDGDGRDDLAVASVAFAGDASTARLDLLLAGDGGTWRRRPLASRPGVMGVWALAFGDLDGDGHRDLVGLTQRGETWVFTGDGHGGFRRERHGPPPFPGACSGSFVSLVDLDGDAHDEIVAAFGEESSTDDGESRCPSGGGITAWTARGPG